MHERIKGILTIGQLALHFFFQDSDDCIHANGSSKAHKKTIDPVGKFSQGKEYVLNNHGDVPHHMF